MKYTLSLIFIGILICSCNEIPKSHGYTSLDIQTVFEDSMSIRAIEFLDENTLAFAGSDGLYGTVDVPSNKVRNNNMRYDTVIPSFRAVAHTPSDFFMLSIGSPALLYKTGDAGAMELVYKEEGEGVFYDAMKFWNATDGIAIGDTVDGCLSIIITRDGGTTWKKLKCTDLPKGIEGEGAFAASNSNIELFGEKAWIATTSGRVFFSDDKGNTWTTIATPIINNKETQGMYSLDFYNENIGFAIGGDFTEPEEMRANKIKTMDGGKTWQVVADNQEPGYKSCVQYVPNSGGQDLMAIGFTGIHYSDNGGSSWRQLSEEGFYTVRFLNDSIAFAAGRNRIAKLVLK